MTAYLHISLKEKKEVTRDPPSPWVSLEDLTLTIDVDKSSVDAVDDKADSKGDEVLCERFAQTVHASARVHAVPRPARYSQYRKHSPSTTSHIVSVIQIIEEKKTTTLNTYFGS